MSQFEFLGKGELHIENASTEVLLHNGELWITFEGDGTDYVLKPGDKIRSPSDGLMVIEALTDSSVSFSKQDHSLHAGV